MKLLPLLFFVLISCGKNAEVVDAAQVTCNLDTDAVKTSWLNTSNGYTYDLTSCSHSTGCRLCFSAFCEGPIDLDITYYPNGQAILNYFMVGNVITADWQVCNGQLKLYNMSNNLEDVSFIEM